MSYGFRVKNNSGNILVSDETYNLVYLGKATFIGVTYTFTSVLNIPTFEVSELKYEINSGGAPIVPFLYNPNSGGNSNRSAFGGIANLELVGNIWTLYIYIDRFASFVPTVYCFRRIASAPLTGYGMAVFDASGAQTYNTNANHINLKSIVNVAYGASSVQCGTFSGYVYCRPSYADTVTAAGPTTLAKPALSYGTQNNSAAYSTGSQRQYFFENLAYYDTSNKLIYTRWGFLANPRTFSGYGFNVSPGTVTTLLIDGAEYDNL